jgi:hypothetical protein
MFFLPWLLGRLVNNWHDPIYCHTAYDAMTSAVLATVTNKILVRFATYFARVNDP